MRDYGFGKGKWVFIDWMGIEPGYGTIWPGSEQAARSPIGNSYCMPRGVRIKAHKGYALPEPVQVSGAPDQGFAEHAYATFLLDDGTYRCWYECRRRGGLGYAESDDGVNWRCPALGLTEWNGSTANNLVKLEGVGAHGTGVFKDPSAPPDERYKMVSCRWTETERAVMGAVSPDGLYWKPLAEPVLPNQHADTKNNCHYDEKRGLYVLYTRQTDGAMQRRGVNRAESADFRRFPESVPVFESIPNDPPDWDIYCSGYSAWPGADNAHVMRLSMYHRTLDTMEVHLATSRDEANWHRHLGEEPWADLGQAYTGTAYAADGITPTSPGEWSTFVATYSHRHNEPPPEDEEVRAYRVPMREDGFVSLSSEGEGEFWTVPFVLESDEISVNVKAAYSGYLRGEILESLSGASTGERISAEKVADGYSLDECIPINGDHINAPLTWRDGPDLTGLQGHTVRLHFTMFNADLYALRF